MRATGIGGDQRGRGWIGFLFALIVVGFLLFSLKQFYDVKHKYDEINDFTLSQIKGMDRRQKSDEDIRFELVKKMRELGITVKDPSKVQIDNEQSAIRVHYEWDDVVQIPWYPVPRHYVLDVSWTRF